MDYEQLLRKYMELVLSCEGITFVNDLTVEGDDPSFTAEEQEALWRIHDEVSK